MKKFSWCLLCCAAFTACKKDNSTPVSPAVQGSCRITSISSTDPDRGYPLQTFKYDSKGLMQSMEWLYNASQYYSHTDIANVTSLSVGSLSGVIPIETFSGNKFTYSVLFSFAGQPGLPSSCSFGNTEFRNGSSFSNTDLMDYTYSYNAKQQLVKVSETTPQPNDYEWVVDITYDQNDNVAKLLYSYSTGPKDVTTLTVSAYDNKPNPFSAIPYWKFIDQRWVSGDPRALIVALSKNNPLKYELGSTQSETFSYTYGDKGFPTAMNFTRTLHPSGNSASFTDTYTYDCP